MIKKVNVEELKPGMFIHNFNCGWLQHPFVSNSKMVKDERFIEKIMKYGIREVYIDTEKGSDVADAPTAEEVRREIEEELKRFVEKTSEVPQDTPIEEELGRAREIKREARKTVQGILDDARFGRQIKREKVEDAVDRMVESILRNQDALISLSRIRKNDEYTYSHSLSVCALTLSFGKHLKLSSRELRELGVGAMLHDVGKMKVPLEILNKTGEFTEEEFDIMKQHVEFGRSLLMENGGIPDTAILAAHEHHERFDGGGYPRGLNGSEISIYGRAVAIADVYDAITSDRCYQKKIQPTHALRKLFEWSKYHFDSHLVERFIRCVGVYPVGTLVHLESGLLAVVIKQGKKTLLEPTVRVVYNIKGNRHLRVPYVLDLADGASNGGGDRVIGYEDPGRWNIQPEMYL